jgi:hypothetical protein
MERREKIFEHQKKFSKRPLLMSPGVVLACVRGLSWPGKEEKRRKNIFRQTFFGFRRTLSLNGQL